MTDIILAGSILAAERLDAGDLAGAVGIILRARAIAFRAPSTVAPLRRVTGYRYVRDPETHHQHRIELFACGHERSWIKSEPLRRRRRCPQCPTLGSVRRTEKGSTSRPGIAVTAHQENQP